VRFFRWYTRRYVPRHLHAVRLSPRGWRPPEDAGPCIVILNHPSWWDPLVCVLLSELFADRKHFAVMDAAALGRYRLLERLGFFGVEPHSRAGALTFVRTGRVILAEADSVLWLTPQGRFADVRERPVQLAGGLGLLAGRLREGTVLPLALEYPFWSERSPEALARFGEPIALGQAVGRTAQGWTDCFAESLQGVQDELARLARRRDPATFDILLQGRAGVGGIYDGWRGLRAWWRGERFRPEHGEEETP
jgi:1-acyl-sn-glycerol-3-phosphate acyltransferase